MRSCSFIRSSCACLALFTQLFTITRKGNAHRPRHRMEVIRMLQIFIYLSIHCTCTHTQTGYALPAGLLAGFYQRTNKRSTIDELIGCDIITCCSHSAFNHMRRTHPSIQKRAARTYMHTRAHKLLEHLIQSSIARRIQTRVDRVMNTHTQLGRTQSV